MFLRILTQETMQKRCFGRQMTHLLNCTYTKTYKTDRKAEKPKKFVRFLTSELQKGEENYEIIYKFPYIRHAYVFCRVKLYQTFITVVMIPISVVLSAFDVVGTDFVFASLGVGSFACGVLYVMGGFFRRLVGIIYLNERKDTVKVAHLTFWGQRRDVTMPLNDVVPFADTGDNPKNVYYKLMRYSSSDVLYYIIRFGGVKKPELFQMVFGESDR